MLVLIIPHIYCLSISLCWLFWNWGSKHLLVFCTLSEPSNMNGTFYSLVYHVMHCYYVITFVLERACLVYVFKHMFSIFKQHYIYFYTLFHLHVFLKNTNNITRTTLPNSRWVTIAWIYVICIDINKSSILLLFNLNLWRKMYWRGIGSKWKIHLIKA